MNERNKCALVTGAARRIGRAIAQALARDGWAVGLHCHRSRDEAEALARDIAAEGGRAAVVTADLADEAAVRGLMPAVRAALGPVTCVVNNASLFERDEPADTDRRLWDAHFAVNLRAPYALAQDLVAQLPAGSPGDVINLLDQRVINPTPHFTSYTLSKSALWTLTQTLALALAPRVRVNAVAPGPVLPSARQTEEQFRRQWGAVPLRRPTAPEEIAAAVRFALETPSMTGQILVLDGGQHLGWTFPKVPPADE